MARSQRQPGDVNRNGQRLVRKTGICAGNRSGGLVAICTAQMAVTSTCVCARPASVAQHLVWNTRRHLMPKTPRAVSVRLVSSAMPSAAESWSSVPSAFMASMILSMACSLGSPWVDRAIGLAGRILPDHLERAVRDRGLAEHDRGVGHRRVDLAGLQGGEHRGRVREHLGRRLGLQDVGDEIGPGCRLLDADPLVLHRGGVDLGSGLHHHADVRGEVGHREVDHLLALVGDRDSESARSKLGRPATSAPRRR